MCKVQFLAFRSIRYPIVGSLPNQRIKQIQNNRQDGTMATFSTTSRTESKIQNIARLQSAEVQTMETLERET